MFTTPFGTWGDNSHLAKGPGGQNQGVQKGLQRVILGLERAPGVLKETPSGPMGPPGPLEISALFGTCSAMISAHMLVTSGVKGEVLITMVLPVMMASPIFQTAISSGKFHLEETGPLSQGVQARRKAFRIRYVNGMEVRKKRPRGFKKEAQRVEVSPLNPPSVAP
jgi:hypothetical protein